MASRGQELRWVLRAQSGDASALNALLESIQEPLYGYILSLLRDPHRAQDTLQDVLIRVIRKLYWPREPRVFRPMPGPIGEVRRNSWKSHAGRVLAALSIGRNPRSMRESDIASARRGAALGHIHRLFGEGTLAGLPDSRLLER
jgi:hypothetical protein